MGIHKISVHLYTISGVTRPPFGCGLKPVGCECNINVYMYQYKYWLKINPPAYLFLFAPYTVLYFVTSQSGWYFHTVRASQTSFVKFNFQTSESNRKDRMSFLPPKLGAIWKFWPSGAILSFSLRLQDSMAPSDQNFHTFPAFGGRNVTIY